MRQVQRNSTLRRDIGVLALVWAATLAAARPAHAASYAANTGLYAAFSHYKKGDYALAFREFLGLARLGQPLAQLDVGYMYAAGRGTQLNDIEAYAWAMLASKNGEAGGAKLAKRLLPDLELAPGSRRIAGWVTAQYTPAVLERRLLPRYHSRALRHGEHAQMRACSPVHVFRPRFPIREQLDGEQGRLVVTFTVMPDGTARLPHVLFEMPPLHKEDFLALTHESVLRSRFAVRPAADGPIQCTIYFQFVQRSLVSSEYPGLNSYLDRAREQAHMGEPFAQLIYGILLAGLPQLHRGQAAALPWLVKAAQAGIPLAQFETGASLMTGWGSAIDRAKGLRWLRLAAAQNQPNAEALLAQQLLRGVPSLPTVQHAVHWLNQAAAQHNRFGEFYLSAVLASWPQPEIRDPKRALQLEKKAVANGVGIDPTGLEIRAAAEAAEGNFVRAVDTERRALARGRALDWNVAALKRRLKRYRSGKPWYGNLLDYGAASVSPARPKESAARAAGSPIRGTEAARCHVSGDSATVLRHSREVAGKLSAAPACTAR